MNNKFFCLGTSIIGATVIGLAPISAIAKSPQITQNLQASEQLTLTNKITSNKSKLILAQNEADYDRAIQLNPNNADAYFNRGLLRYEQKNYKSAEADYTQAIRINPQDALAYTNRGLIRYEQKNYKSAEADYTQAIKINPNDADVYFNRGLLRRDLKNYPAAEADFTQTIRINPQDAQAYVNRGIARAYTNNKPGAIADWQAAAQLYRQQNNTEAYQKIQEGLSVLQTLPE